MRRLALVLALLFVSVCCSAQTLKVTYGEKQANVELAKLPHQDVKVTDEHMKKERVYSCTTLANVLASVDAPKGKGMHGPGMTLVVIAKSKDDYRVVFSLAELDETLGNASAYVCDKESGQPLNEKQAPFQLLVTSDKHPSRSARMVTEISLVQAPSK